MLEKALTVAAPLLFALAAWLRKSTKPRRSAIEEMREELAIEKAFVETFAEGTPERAALDRKLRLGVARYVDDRIWESRDSILEWRRLQRILNTSLVVSILGLLVSGTVVVGHEWLSSDVEEALRHATVFLVVGFVFSTGMVVLSRILRSRSRTEDKRTEPTLTLAALSPVEDDESPAPPA